MKHWFSSRSAGLYAGGLVSLAAAITAGYWVPPELAHLEALGISFAHPRWLWLAALALGLPLLAPFGLTDLPKPQRALQVLVRAALVVLLAVAAAGPRSLQKVPRRVQILHLVDRSESVPDELLAAAAASARATNLQVLKIEADQPTLDAADEERLPPVTVVAFDGEAERLPWPPTDTDTETDDAVPSPVIARHPAASRETDLAGALNVALGLLDAQSVPHVVIWSDGIETRGDASELVQTLKAAGVRVHTPALPPMPTQAEFLIERFDLPPVVRANVPFLVAISVQSSAIARVACRVKAPGQDLPPVTAQVQPGATRVELGQLRLKDGGTAELNASCSLVDGADRFAANNHLRARVIVRARPKILYVEGVATQAQQLARALGDDYEVDVRGGDGLPNNLPGLKQFQAVILSDVPRVTPAGVQLLSDGDMRNLHAYAQQGGGLLVIGGENSLGSGGYQNTYLDKHVLPVRMDIESSVENPTIALMLLIDRSGSMSGSKMELAKEAARATAEAMAHEDRIGVVAFDSEARTAVRLQRAGNRYRIATDISKLTPSGGTHIYPALEIAWQALQSTPAKIKHVIVLTDGQAPRAGPERFPGGGGPGGAGLGVGDGRFDFLHVWLVAWGHLAGQLARRLRSIELGRGRRCHLGPDHRRHGRGHGRARCPSRRAGRPGRGRLAAGTDGVRRGSVWLLVRRLRASGCLQAVSRLCNELPHKLLRHRMRRRRRALAAAGGAVCRGRGVPDDPRVEVRQRLLRPHRVAGVLPR